MIQNSSQVQFMKKTRIYPVANFGLDTVNTYSTEKNSFIRGPFPRNLTEYST